MIAIIHTISDIKNISFEKNITSFKLFPHSPSGPGAFIMKITSQEEYGLRILLRIARCHDEESMSIQALSVAEGLSPAYVAKLTRLLRQAGYINSTPGNVGGYILSKPAVEININLVLKTLGGSLFSKEFCNDFSGANRLCTNSVDCSVRSLWQMVQFSVDQLLDKISLNDLIGTEKKSDNMLNFLLQQHQYPQRKSLSQR